MGERPKNYCDLIKGPCTASKKLQCGRQPIGIFGKLLGKTEVCIVAERSLSGSTDNSQLPVVSNGPSSASIWLEKGMRKIEKGKLEFIPMH
ncbi:hypothetical protein JXA63_01300 [Candidatus Woesebacteria bacterium]|nr:hypothetical protein [Candidatus Woesebacteria bacterium]